MRERFADLIPRWRLLHASRKAIVEAYDNAETDLADDQRIVVTSAELDYPSTVEGTGLLTIRFDVYKMNERVNEDNPE